ncbi:uncharacterized protein TNCV_1470731 [Trichonephila clavipes]|nr:uncharacterized protein TNCV_1470731 [Trichonephila clavipes]
MRDAEPSGVYALQKCFFEDTEETYNQPIDKSGLTPASHQQRSVGQGEIKGVPKTSFSSLRDAASCKHAICTTSRRSGRWFVVRGILYKFTLTRNPRCSTRRRIDEADISTPVALDQSAFNCLEETVGEFTVMRIRCRSSCADVIFRRPLPVFQIVQGSSAHCFKTRITVELFRSTRAPISR